MLCLCHDGPALLRFWFQTSHGRENSASYLKIQAGKTFSYPGHALVTLYVQFFCSDLSKFDRWVNAEKKRVLCQHVMFLTVFSTGCSKWNTAAIKSLLLFMASLFIGFLVERCVACQSRKSDFGWHRFRFSPCFMGIKESSQFSSDSGVTW